MVDDDHIVVGDESALKDEVVEEVVEEKLDIHEDEVDPYKEADQEGEDETYLNLAVMREMDPYGEYEAA